METHLPDSLANPPRLRFIGRSGNTTLHGTKTTIPCTNPSQNEKRGCPSGETLSQVWATGLLANRMKVCLLQD